MTTRGSSVKRSPLDGVCPVDIEISSREMRLLQHDHHLLHHTIAFPQGLTFTRTNQVEGRKEGQKKIKIKKK